MDHWIPLPGCCGIEVAGTITLDNGWTLVGSQVTIRAWEDGLEVTTKTISASSTSWSGVIDGLNCGTTYNVIVEVAVTNGCTTEILITEPRTAKVP